MKKYYFIMEKDDDDDEDYYGLSSETGVVFSDENEAKKYVKFLNDNCTNLGNKYSYVEDEFEECITAEKALEKLLKEEVNYYKQELEKCSHLSLFNDLSQEAKEFNTKDVVLTIKDVKFLITLFKMHYDIYKVEIGRSEVSQFMAEVKLFNIDFTTENYENVEIKLNVAVVRQILDNAKYIYMKEFVC